MGTFTVFSRQETISLWVAETECGPGGDDDDDDDNNDDNNNDDDYDDGGGRVMMLMMILIMMMMEVGESGRQESGGAGS